MVKVSSRLVGLRVPVGSGVSCLGLGETGKALVGKVRVRARPGG